MPGPSRILTLVPAILMPFLSRLTQSPPSCANVGIARHSRAMASMRLTDFSFIFVLRRMWIGFVVEFRVLDVVVDVYPSRHVANRWWSFFLATPILLNFGKLRFSG